MQICDGLEVGMRHERSQVTGDADFDVILGQVISVDQDFAKLVGDVL